MGKSRESERPKQAAPTAAAKLSPSEITAQDWAIKRRALIQALAKQAANDLKDRLLANGEDNN